MHRLFLVTGDKEFAEWIEDELSDYGRFVRKLESLDFFYPQWNAAGADIIVLPEGEIESEESFLRIMETVKSQEPETLFLFIHYRDEDEFIRTIVDNGNICVSYDDLDTGLLEEKLRNHYTNHNTAKSNPPCVQDTYEGVSKHEPEVKPAVEVPLRPENPEDGNSKDEREATKESIPVPPPSSAQVKRKRTAEEQKAKLQKIKERIIIEEKIITVHVPVHYNSVLISIVSLYPGVGATFVTSNFARMLGENKVPVAVLEAVSQTIGSTYYELMFGVEKAPREWIPWSEQIQKQGYVDHKTNWEMGGVNWIPSGIEPVTKWTEEYTMKMLLSAKKYPVTLCDISHRYSESFGKKILSMSDQIWIVVDGDPVQLVLHHKIIEELKNEYRGSTFKVIGNKWNKHIKSSEWKEAVLIPVLAQIPDLGSIVFKYLWDGKMAWDDSKLKNTLAGPFKAMARAVLPKEMYHLIRTQYGFTAAVKGLFKQLKSLDDESSRRST